MCVVLGGQGACHSHGRHSYSVLLTDKVPLLFQHRKAEFWNRLINVVDYGQMPRGGIWDIGKCEKALGVPVAMFEGGLEALQGPCGGMGEEAAPHIDPVARKGKASCLGAEEWQVADRVMTTQGGVALPRDGAFDVSVTLPEVGEIASPSGLFR